MKRLKISNLSFLLLLMVIVLCISYLWQNTNQGVKLEYSQVRQLFLQEKVDSFTITDNTLTLNLKKAYEGSKTATYELYDFQLFYDDLNPLVEEQTEKGILKSYDYHGDVP